MKVALIEDRVGRMNQFLGEDISKFEDILLITGNTFYTLTKALDEGSTESLNAYPCILAHRSAFERKQLEVLREFCKEARKPLAFFSGGITASIYNDSVFPYLHINSKDFYSKNLELFLDNQRTTGDFNFLVLQFGPQWRMTLLLRLRNDINYLKKRGNIQFMRDLKINKLIKHELISAFSLEWLNRSDISPVSEKQVDEFYEKLNALIIESV